MIQFAVPFACGCESCERRSLRRNEFVAAKICIPQWVNLLLNRRPRHKIEKFVECGDR
jgi:hypothetical protein